MLKKYLKLYFDIKKKYFKKNIFSFNILIDFMYIFLVNLKLVQGLVKEIAGK